MPIKIYTDGACAGNPGPMGIGIVFIVGSQTKEYSEFLGHGTNNIAELTAVLKSLKLINDKSNNIEIYTDSEYVIGTFQKNYKSKKNIELIKKIKNEIQKFADVKFIKVPAHSNDHYNNVADKLAVRAIEEKDHYF